MKKLVCPQIGLLFAALLLAAGSANQAMAQEKAMSQEKTTAAAPRDERKVLVDNDKVQVAETRFRPGAESESTARPYRVIRALEGGTLQLIYPDGKKETAEWKTGEVRVLEPTEAYKVKNIGQSDVLLYVVLLKQ